MREEKIGGTMGCFWLFPGQLTHSATSLKLSRFSQEMRPSSPDKSLTSLDLRFFIWKMRL